MIWETTSDRLHMGSIQIPDGRKLILNGKIASLATGSSCNARTVAASAFYTPTARKAPLALYGRLWALQHRTLIACAERIGNCFVVRQGQGTQAGTHDDQNEPTGTGNFPKVVSSVLNVRQNKNMRFGRIC